MKQKPNHKYSFSKNEEKVWKLINSLQVGVVIYGPQTEVLFCNNAALEILGFTKNDIRSRSSFFSESDIIQEDGSPFPINEYPVQKAIKIKKTVANTIMGIYRPDKNERVWLLVNAEPFTDSNGKIHEVVCSFGDITARKAIEAKLTWLYKSLEIRAFELATSNADLERFINIATHDLQEPLRLVSSFTQLLKKKYEKQLDEQACEYINYAVEGAARMKKLILDLLEYSKFCNNKEGFAQTDMNKVLNEVSQQFVKEMKDADMELIIPDLPVISANTSLMKQLFENLIGNALKYRNGVKPIIKIDCREEEDNFLFSVNDNGIGIERKYWEKIFLLFQRIHNDNSSGEGTGVGLAICKKIVELHRGTIWVISEEGKGSTFYFTIAKKQDQVYEKI